MPKSQKVQTIGYTVVNPSLQSKNPKSNVTKKKNRHQNIDYTTIADRLRTVNWISDSHSTGVVKPVYGIPTFLLTTKTV